jgi:CHAD domain-containing protein
MAKSKSWEIIKLSKKDDLVSSAQIVLSQRLKTLLITIKTYFKDSNPETLHQVRIALRRIRYSMELFTVCFNRKKYFKFYCKVSELQDLSGEVRDIDIIRKHIKQLGKQIKPTDMKVNSEILTARKNKIIPSLEMALFNFIHSIELNTFKKQIKYQI